MGNLFRLCRWLRGASAVCLAVALIPSVCFLARLERGVSGERTTDGIVALSGEPQRFVAAMTLLAGQKAQRLLLVGLDNADVVAKLGQERPDLFICCVDVDARSRTTREDAALAARWVRDRGLRSLTVVTDKYHMPRALLELDAVLPDVEKVAYPLEVHSDKRPEKLRWIGREYLKFLASAVTHLLS
jgi:uncharacterized SAM-binding protein YcdF (DUF218 family)